MSQELFTLQAAAAVAASASGAGVVPTFTNNFGFNATTSIHTVAGAYGLDLDAPLAAADAVCVATPRSASADTQINVAQTSDTRKTVTTLVAGVASDAVAFDVLVFRKPGA